MHGVIWGRLAAVGTPQSMTASCGSLAIFRPDVIALSKSYVVQMQIKHLGAVKFQMIDVCPARLQEFWPRRNSDGSFVATTLNANRATVPLGVKAGPYHTDQRQECWGDRWAGTSLGDSWITQTLLTPTQASCPSLGKKWLFLSHFPFSSKHYWTRT